MYKLFAPKESENYRYYISGPIIAHKDGYMSETIIIKEDGELDFCCDYSADLCAPLCAPTHWLVSVSDSIEEAIKIGQERQIRDTEHNKKAEQKSPGLCLNVRIDWHWMKKELATWMANQWGPFPTSTGHALFRSHMEEFINYMAKKDAKNENN